MASQQLSSTHDIRSAAVVYKRDNDHKHKWAFGQVPAPGRRDLDDYRRPKGRLSQRVNTAIRRGTGQQQASLQHRATLARKYDIITEQYTSGESSADDDVMEGPLMPEPDAEITYSFDAARGPSKGSQILSLALTKALERFENKQTDKLIKEEYEVLDSDGESLGTGASSKSKGRATLEDEDFEFV